MDGKLLILSAPSGSGKTTIIKYLMEQGLNIEFSVSACNRKKRKGEIHGKDYYFLNTEEFKEKITNNEFIEWEEVYKDHFYGTLKSEFERIWNSGKHVILDIDVEGGMNLKKQFGEKALAVFIMPPSIEILEQRLRNRAPASNKEIEERIKKAEQELAYAKGFDKVVINDILENARKEVLQAVKNFIL